jgi:branched-chain amino acid transport system permease protein
VSGSLVLLEKVLQALAAGVLVEGGYALMCPGLGMIFSVMRVVNFAQGEFLMPGKYGTLYINSSPALGNAFGRRTQRGVKR